MVYKRSKKVIDLKYKGIDPANKKYFLKYYFKNYTTSQTKNQNKYWGCIWLFLHDFSLLKVQTFGNIIIIIVGEAVFIINEALWWWVYIIFAISERLSLIIMINISQTNNTRKEHTADVSGQIILRILCCSHYKTCSVAFFLPEYGSVNKVIDRIMLSKLFI